MIRMNSNLYQITIKYSGPEKTTGPTGVNRHVVGFYERLYLVFIVRTYF